MERRDLDDAARNREAAYGDSVAATQERSPYGMQRTDTVEPAGRTEVTQNGGAALPEAQTLLPAGSLDTFASRWQRIQTGFVDEPRTAVRDAESLVNDMIEELTNIFTRERQQLERDWDQGSDVSTEDLRVALQRYRAFFQRLLAA